MPGHLDNSDWNPKLYLRFSDHRIRPALELLDQIPAQNPRLIYDLGCGTGHITTLLAQAWPTSKVIGIDHSAQMLEKAHEASSDIQWQQVDIQDWEPQEPPDIIYSNAALHWVEGHSNLFPALLNFLSPGGYLAVQMPLSWGQPSHRLMRETLANGGPNGSSLGTSALRETVGRKWVDDTEVYYHLLNPLAAMLDIWETEYLQILSGEDAVFEWVRGTGLRPILQDLPEDQLGIFIREYRRRLNAAYPRQNDGHTLYPFRRLFIVVQKLGGK